MIRPTTASVFLICAAILGIGCGDDTPTSPTDPSTPVTITETFPSADAPGTLTPNGGITHAFAVQRAGEITAVLTTLSAGTAVGLSLGTWNGSACSASIVRDATTQGQSVVGGATATGNYCVRIYDAAGSLTGPVEYQIAVTHF